MENTYQMGQYAELGTGDIISFLSAVGVTLAIILISLLLGTILGTILGIIRCSKNKIISAAPLLIMEPLRNSPLVVQLFLVYFGLPVAAHIVLNPFSAAISCRICFRDCSISGVSTFRLYLTHQTM